MLEKKFVLKKRMLDSAFHYRVAKSDKASKFDFRMPCAGSDDSLNLPGFSDFLRAMAAPLRAGGRGFACPSAGPSRTGLAPPARKDAKFARRRPVVRARTPPLRVKILPSRGIFGRQVVTLWQLPALLLPIHHRRPRALVAERLRQRLRRPHAARLHLRPDRSHPRRRRVGHVLLRDRPPVFPGHQRRAHAYENQILTAANGTAMPALPTVPAVPAPPASTILAGIEARRISWVQEVKNKPGYNASVGAQLGIETPFRAVRSEDVRLPAPEPGLQRAAHRRREVPQGGRQRGRHQFVRPQDGHGRVDEPGAL